MGTATFLRQRNLVSGQDAAIYRLDPPFQPEAGPEVEYAWVSSVTTKYGDETIAFAATGPRGGKAGGSLHQVPVPGRSHAEALGRLGYHEVKF